MSREKSIFEKLGGTYTEVDGILYPNIVIGEEKTKRIIGKYGILRRTYLKEHCPARYNILLLTGELYSHLADIDEQAQNQMDILVDQMRTAEGVTEELKSCDWLQWLQKANSIQHRAEEIVLMEIVYSKDNRQEIKA